MSRNMADQQIVERIIDQRGVAEILEMISVVCKLKSEFISSNWQDKELAQEWEEVGRLVRRLIEDESIVWMK